MAALTPLETWIAGKIGCAPTPLTRNALAAYQLQRLQETVTYCRVRSPFYRERLAPFPDAPFSLEAWQAYPFTTASDLRQRPLSFLCVSQSEIERVVTLDTSGTSGPPKRLYFSAADLELTRDFFRVGMSTFTAPGDRVLILLPCERPDSVGDLLRQALARLGAHGICHGLVRDVAEAQRILRESEATVVVGVPVQVLAMVRSTVAGDGPRPRLKSVLLTMDHVPAAIVQAVQAAWRCTVYNHYGMVEMGLGGGVQCEAQQGYHLREADLYFEVVHPETGAPVPDGEPGEIVFTTLTRTAMPLLRYRTGDISRFLHGDCSCGTVLRRLARVRYRRQGCLPLGGEQFLAMADLDDALFPLDGILDFVATLSPGVLQVTAQAAEEVGRAAQEALAAMPALQNAGLAVQVVTQRRPLAHAGKRSIQIAA